ncbi:MAG TPA: hypothetical protein VF483_09245 [Gemmatimonadaceae bacterium]
MKVNSSPGRRVARLCLPVLLAACSDGSTDVAAPSRPAIAAVVPNSVAFTDTAWDTFVAQVTLRTSRVDSVNGPVQRASVPLNYTLERHRRGDDWDTKLRIPRQSWMPSPGASTGRIASVTFGAAGDMLAEDESGAPIDIQLPNPALRGPRPSSAPSPRFAQILATGSAARPTRRPPHTKGNAWVQAYVTDRTHARMQRDRIRAKLGAPRGAKGGMEWYESRSGADTRRVFVDADKGLVRSVELERNGKRIRTTSYSYVEQPDGSLVRSGIHSEAVPADGHAGGTVDVQFTDVHLEKRATP